MIEVVLKSLNIDGNFIFIVRKEDIEKYNINYFLKNLKKCKIIILDKIRRCYLQLLMLSISIMTIH